MRTSRVIALSSLLGSTLVAGLFSTGGTATAAGNALTWCTEGTPTYPCVVSASHDGTPITVDDEDWAIVGAESDASGSRDVNVNVLRQGSNELGSESLGIDFDITIATGTLVPRVVSGKAKGISVTRSEPDGVHQVRVQANPVTVSGQCEQASWPWSCPEEAVTDTPEWDAYLDFQITDYRSWDDAAQRASFNGMHYFTNVAATSIPPEIAFDGAGDPFLLIRMANRHFMADGSTLVSGSGELRIPNAFLKEVYGIPNPATMSGVSLDAGLSGSGTGTTTVAQETGETAMLVTYDNVSFSTRVLRVKTGTITPTKPLGTHAERTGARRGTVSFLTSEPRGANVTGYKVRCASGAHVVAAAGTTSAIPVTGLRSGKGYDCKVRATSKAGPSSWSVTARMPARPA